MISSRAGRACSLSLSASVSLALTLACAPPDPLASPRERVGLVAGCYALELSEAPGHEESAKWARETFPSFRLMPDSLGALRPDLHRVRLGIGATPDTAAESAYPFRWWSVGQTTDSVVIAVGHGLGGLGMRFMHRGDSLVGEVGESGDVDPFYWRIGAATAVRVTCPPDRRVR